jgi:hypothetical protein
MLLNKKNFRISICLLTLFSGMVILSKAQSNPVLAPTVQRGFIDLRNIQLNQNTVPISGDWGIYWGQLLTPKDSINKPSVYTYFPKHWNYTTLNQQVLSAEGFATYTVQILINSKEQQNLAIKLPDTYCSFKLFVFELQKHFGNRRIFK